MEFIIKIELIFRVYMSEVGTGVELNIGITFNNSS